MPEILRIPLKPGAPFSLPVGAAVKLEGQQAWARKDWYFVHVAGDGDGMHLVLTDEAPPA